MHGRARGELMREVRARRGGRGGGGRLVGTDADEARVVEGHVLLVVAHVERVALEADEHRDDPDGHDEYDEQDLDGHHLRQLCLVEALQRRRVIRCVVVVVVVVVVVIVEVVRVSGGAIAIG